MQLFQLPCPQTVVKTVSAATSGGDIYFLANNGRPQQSQADASGDTLKTDRCKPFSHRSLIYRPWTWRIRRNVAPSRCRRSRSPWRSGGGTRGSCWRSSVPDGCAAPLALTSGGTATMRSPLPRCGANWTRLLRWNTSSSPPSSNSLLQDEQYNSPWKHGSRKVIAHWTPPHTTTVLRHFFRDYSGEPLPEENFWTSWCKGRLTEADTPTIRLGATPSGLTSAHLHHPPIFYRPGALPAAKPTVSKHWRQLAHSD